MSFQGQKLKGACLGNGVFSGIPLRSMSAHMMGSVYLCTPGDFSGGNFLRGRPQGPPPDTEPHVNFGATYYGKNAGSFTFPDTTLFFDLADLEEWDTLAAEDLHAQLYPNHTTYQRLMRRDQKNEPFENLSSVQWTTADLDVYENDWLGNLMPGGWCYTSRGVPEPMRGEVYYEDARKTTDPLNILDKSQASVRENWTPFCTPLKVRNNSGSVLGTFDGLSYILFFNAAAVKVPLKKWHFDTTLGDYTGEAVCGMLPRDLTLPVLGDNPSPWLDPHRQILSVEAWFYLNSSAPSTFKSPRFATCRWWHYTKGLEYLDGGPYTSPFNPYLFLQTNQVSNFIHVPMTFKLLQNENNPENLETVSKELYFHEFQIFFGA